LYIYKNSLFKVNFFVKRLQNVVYSLHAWLCILLELCVAGRRPSSSVGLPNSNSYSCSLAYAAGRRLA